MEMMMWMRVTRGGRCKMMSMLLEAKSLLLIMRLKSIPSMLIIWRTTSICLDLCQSMIVLKRLRFIRGMDCTLRLSMWCMSLLKTSIIMAPALSTHKYRW